MHASDNATPQRVAVIGGGPSGLMAAEMLAQGGARVDVYDAMPSVGRKLLMAGRGGLNLTHSEPTAAFLARYGTRRTRIEPLIRAFDPAALRAWVQGLGIDTFVGTSGRVFPVGMKAAPLLRAWLLRLRNSGVRFHVRHCWRGWDARGALFFSTPQGDLSVDASSVVLALGGGSWTKLGSTGAWVPLLAQRGIHIAALRPSNCGFDAPWSGHFSTRFAGQPVKSVVATFIDSEGGTHSRRGEFMITATGVEGSLIYALSAQIRDEIAASGSAVIALDLAPGIPTQRVTAELLRPRGARTMANHLRSRLGIAGVKAGLLRELMPPQVFADTTRLGAAIKSLPLRVIAARPLDEAISSAGGVAFEALDESLMICALPGVFCAGEMLDWEAPTGGYLLTACFASGRAAGLGALAWQDSDKDRAHSCVTTN